MRCNRRVGSARYRVRLRRIGLYALNGSFQLASLVREGACGPRAVKAKPFGQKTRAV